MDEVVAVIPRGAVDYFLRSRSFAKVVGVLEDGLLPCPKTQELETDETLLQVCTYTIVTKSPDLMLTYCRPAKQGDKRLHGKRSVGFGGHVNSIDMFQGNSDFSPIIEGAVRRELREELGVGVGKVSAHGIVHYLGDAVGRVHLGLVSHVDDGDLDGDPLSTTNLDEVSELKWMRREDAAKLDDWEAWSAIYLGLPVAGEVRWLTQD